MRKYREVTNVEKIKSTLLGVILFCALLEMLFFPSIPNFVGVVVSILSTLLYFNLVLIPSYYKKNPLLFIVSISPFCFMYFPLPATLLDGKSLSHDFFNPELTFLFQFLYFSLFVFALIVASKLSKNHRGLNNFLNRVGYFNVPAFGQTYVLAGFGWIFYILKIKTQYTGDGEYVAYIGTYTMFVNFIYFPLLNIFRDLLGGKSCSSKEKIITWSYFGLLTLSTVATNSRGSMLSSTIIITICFVIRRILSNKEIKIFTIPNIVVAIFLFFVFTGPFDDMALAMLMARGERKNMDYKELFSKTQYYYNDKEALNRYRRYIDIISKSQNYSTDWNESYVSNVFLQRLCNYRVVDASIYHAFRAGVPNERMTNFFFNRLIAMFPQPIVDIIDPSFNKSKYAHSPMDLLYSLSKRRSLYVSYIVGGDVGLGLATFGFLYFPLVFFVYVLKLLLLANLVRITKRGIQFSSLTLIGIYNYFITFQVGAGFINHVQFLLWSFWWGEIWRFIPFRLLTIRK